MGYLFCIKSYMTVKNYIKNALNIFLISKKHILKHFLCNFLLSYMISCKISTENKHFLLILHLVIKWFLFYEILSCNQTFSNCPYINVIMIVITQLFIHSFNHSINHLFIQSFTIVKMMCPC